MAQRAPNPDGKWIARAGLTILGVGIFLLIGWLYERGRGPHGGGFLFIGAVPLIIIGGAIVVAAWAFRPGPDPLRDPRGTDAEQDSDRVRHN